MPCHDPFLAAAASIVRRKNSFVLRRLILGVRERPLTFSASSRFQDGARNSQRGFYDRNQRDVSIATVRAEGSLTADRHPPDRPLAILTGVGF